MERLSAKDYKALMIAIYNAQINNIPPPEFTGRAKMVATIIFPCIERRKKQSEHGLASAAARRVKKVEYNTNISSTVANTVANTVGNQSKEKKNKGNKTTDKPGAAQNAAPDRQNIFIELPLNDGTMRAVTRTEIAHWKDLYRAVDVETEVRKMRGWLDANPKNRKTAAGILRYMTRWLGKAQDQARTVGSSSQRTRTAQGYEELT